MNRDEVFVPKTKSFMMDRCGKKEGEGKKIVEKGPDGQVSELEELLEDAPIYRLWTTVMQQLVGWFAYLAVNASGQKSYPKWTNHFDPASIIFDSRHRSQIITSDIALLVVGAGLAYLKSYLGGWGEFMKWWGIPYLAVNHWLVMVSPSITSLHLVLTGTF
jgi:omega-6 fatty acid desaturase (delta-12 desaturase)